MIKPLYDGPVNLALKTGKKIVPVALVKDYENNVAYLDVGNPIDVRNLDLNIQDYYPGKEESEKYRIKSMSSYVRDHMATAVYHMMERHLVPMKRNEYGDMGHYFVDFYVMDTYRKLNWKHDVFEAEYLTKKTDEEREYEAVSFLIGGSLGTSNELIRRADVKMSFSDMTFPHQLMRVMLLDQIRIICDK